jgi:AraC-like DNA-binding protein
MVSMGGDSRIELSIDTGHTHPDHALLSFISLRAVRKRPWPEPWQEVEVSSSLVIARFGKLPVFRCAGRWRVLLVLLPREQLAALAPELPQRPQRFQDRSVVDRAVESFIEATLAAEAEVSGIGRYAIEQLAIEMCAAVVLDRAGLGAARPLSERLRDRADAVIAQQCRDASLSPAAVAEEIGVALRTLQDAFSETGSTIAREIRVHRARLAHSLLTSTRYRPLTIAEIAAHAGFNSPMSLRRAINEEYASTPRALRRTTLS